MSILDRFTLQKLKITAYKKSTRSMQDKVSDFTAMYNPASISQKYEIKYGKNQGKNSSGKKTYYSYSKPAELKLKLILDGTGVHEMGIFINKQTPVAERVDEFLNLAFHMNGSIHEPHYLSVEWGDLKFWGDAKFNCRLGNATVKYTHFNRDGTALRAELDITLYSDEDVEKRKKKENKSSPDLTHIRVVKNGDTLPLLCKEIYGNSFYYLRVAQANNLNNFRALVPGQELVFPPLEKE